jgi:predicted GNAT superfamily acetyltransferase
MSFAFLGRIEGRLCLYSQLTGVVPEYQSRGLGYRIKVVQRDFARTEGIALIAWAFDPLQAGNAHFNLARLGASAGRYFDNMYGERTDALNAGVPTDRLIAEWDVNRESDPGPRQDSVEGLPRLISLRTGEGSEAVSDGPPVPIGLERASAVPRVLLEIPAEIGNLRRDRPALAEQWRQWVRRAFQSNFEAGYRAIDLLRDDRDGRRRVFYVLERREQPTVPFPVKIV